MKSMERNSRNRPTSASCSSAVHGEPRKEKKRNESASESEGRWRAREDVVDDLTTSPHRENGEAPPTDSAWRWRSFGRAPPSIPCPVLHRERHGRGRMVYDKWGPGVRFKFG